jgi:hypothetical protein
MSKRASSSKTTSAPAKQPLLETPHPLDTLFKEEELEAAVQEYLNTEYPVLEEAPANVQPPPLPKHTFKKATNFYNGYLCRFLAEPVKMKLFSSAMCITCNDSVAIFRMPRLLRKRLADRVNDVFEAGLAIPGTTQPKEKRNPFKNSPVFLRFAESSQVFFQHDFNGEPELVPRAEVKRGMYFHGRLEVELLGMKFARDGSAVLPMLRISQLLKMAEPYSMITVEETAVCVLDEPVTDEDDSEDDGQAV